MEHMTTQPPTQPIASAEQSLVRDIATIPNAISALGALLVWHGSNHLDTGWGFGSTLAGRVADLLDGQIARKTGQTSDLGAAVDATLDKLAVTKIGRELYDRDIAPKWFLKAMGALAITNSLATALAAQQLTETSQRPTTSGKLAMASQNLALLSYAGSRLLTKQAVQSERENGQEPTRRSAKVVRRLGHTAAVLGIGLGMKAAGSYITRAVRARSYSSRPAQE